MHKFVVLPPPAKGKLHEGRDFCSPLYSQFLDGASTSGM